MPGAPDLQKRWGVSSVASSRRFAGRLSEGDDLLGRTLVEAGQLDASTFTVDPASHQVQQGAGFAYAYDARGQRASATWLATGSQTDYRYDADGRLVEAGGREFIYDGLGRRVGNRTAAGLEVLVPDGDHAVVTYRPDGTLAKRSMYGDRIDEVIADQADLDSSRDGIPDTTLYPIQDAQGTLLGLVDRDGRVVESYLMDASGRARIYGRDEIRPEVVMVRYRVAEEAGAEVPAWIEVVLSEGVRGEGRGESGPGSGGIAFSLKDTSGTSITSTLDGRRANEGLLLFSLASTLIAGSYSVELSGVEDVAGNVVEAFSGTGSIVHPTEDAVLATGPRAGNVLALLDGPDGIAVVTNVPIDPASVASAVTVKKQGEVVTGASQFLGETTLLWIPENPAAWIEGANYEVILSAGLLDISGRPIATPEGSLGFTHLAQGDAIWTRPNEAPLRQQSAYGNDRFLHGRPYLADLGLSDHRARFYEPGTQTFLSPDPLGPLDAPSLYQAFGWDGSNVTDPWGECLFGIGGTCSEWADAIGGKFGEWKAEAGTWGEGGRLSMAADFAVSTTLDLAEAVLIDPMRVGEATGEAIGSGAGAVDVALSVGQDLGRGAAIAGGAGAVAGRTLRAARTVRPAGQRSAGILKEVAKRALPEKEIAFATREPYEGVREASAYLRVQGVPRPIRKQVLESFDRRAMRLRLAGEQEFGVRYYDQILAFPRGRTLFETFPASRSSLALKPEWNQMRFLKQWRIRPGTKVFEGPAAPQGLALPGGQTQKYILQLEDLLEP